MQPLEMPDPSSLITMKSLWLDELAVSRNEEERTCDDLLIDPGDWIWI
jgi:hypothetical protein